MSPASTTHETHATHDGDGRPAEGALRRLRRAAGYTSARAFADEIGIPVTTYARYERIPDGPRRGIPIAVAWSIADYLGTSIDVVVGRTDGVRAQAREGAPELRSGELEARAAALDPASRADLEDYLSFLELRERISAPRGGR